MQSTNINQSDEKEAGQALFIVSILQSLLKGFSVFYFLLLPILYATHVISAEQVGYIGALLIAGVLVGAFTVTYKLHVRSNENLLQVALVMLFAGNLLLFYPNNALLLCIAYSLIGLANGVGISATNALSAHFTTHGKRYKAMAKMSMLMDGMRIVYPIVAGAIYAWVGFMGLVWFALATVIGFGVFVYVLKLKFPLKEEPTNSTDLSAEPIRNNKPFIYVMFLEFLDSFASSQLYVFLPTLFIFKNFSIEHALVMQSVLFAGYLSGRWLIGALAHRSNGLVAVGIAETGMVITLILLLIAPPNAILYVLCFILGLFTRGTSPVIKAMAFDRLLPSQMKRGSAIHVISGDSGSAIGQLLFGLLLAWLGITAPFIAAAICAAVVAVACFVPPRSFTTA